MRFELFIGYWLPLWHPFLLWTYVVIVSHSMSCCTFIMSKVLASANISFNLNINLNFSWVMVFHPILTCINIFLPAAGQRYWGITAIRNNRSGLSRLPGDGMARDPYWHKNPAHPINIWRACRYRGTDSPLCKWHRTLVCETIAHLHY